MDKNAKQLAFIQLTTVPEGAQIWVVCGAIWAVEKDPQENYTIVRTAGENVLVAEQPESVLAQMVEVMTPDVPSMPDDQIEVTFGRAILDQMGEGPIE